MRSKEELIKKLGVDMATSNSSLWEKAKAEFTLSCVNDIIEVAEKLDKSIQDNSRSNEAIANKMFWLNIVIAAAIIVGSIATAIIAFK